jgi:hypothetical protein
MVRFSQCRYNLRSPDTGLLMKKQTKLLTNSKAIAKEFGGKDCA